MYGRLIWFARIDTPKIRKSLRTDGSRSTPPTAWRASEAALPWGTTDGRMSRDPTSSRTTVPAERAAPVQKTAVRGRPSPSTMMAPRTGPIAKPRGEVAPKRAVTVPTR